MTLALADGPVLLDAEDIQVRLQAKPAGPPPRAAPASWCSPRSLARDLVREGLAREFVRALRRLANESGSSSRTASR